MYVYIYNVCWNQLFNKIRLDRQDCFLLYLLLLICCAKSIWNTETKCSQIFNYTQVTNYDVKPSLSYYMAKKLRKSLGTFQQEPVGKSQTYFCFQLYRNVLSLRCIFVNSDSNVTILRKIPWELTEEVIFFQETCAS